MSTVTFPPAGDWIRGISIKQPWTTAILTGAKTIENRPQPWSWRGWLLLHAGCQTDRPALRVPYAAHAAPATSPARSDHVDPYAKACSG